jgi:hypothetical protein
MVQSVLIYGAETWSLWEDDRRRINAIETDALRRSARFSKLDRKTNEYIREKTDAPDTILGETRKQLIWYGHGERMDPTRLPKIMINWKPEGRKKRGRIRRTRKDGIYTAMSEMEYGSGKASPGVLKLHTHHTHTHTHIYIYIYTHTYVSVFVTSSSGRPLRYLHENDMFFFPPNARQI